MRDKIHGWLTKLTLAFLASWLVASPCIAATPHLQLTVGPDSDLRQVVRDVPAQSEATITVKAGRYSAHDLWRPGVNWFFEPGARVSWTDTTADDWGIFDDRNGGAGTNWIVGGSFDYINDDPDDTTIGAFVFTNANTIARINVSRVSIRVNDGGAGTLAGAFCVKNCRLAVLHADDIVDPGASSSYAAGLYWENGQTYLSFDRMSMDNGYGIWCIEPPGAPAVDLWVEGKHINVAAGLGVPSCVRFTATNANYRAWINVSTLDPASGNYAVGMDGTGGKLYVKAQKVGHDGGGFLVNAGELWVEADKVTAQVVPFATVTGGFADFAVRHWEDVSNNVPTGIVLTGGQTTIGPGRLIMGNGRGIFHGGGTNRLIGLVVNTIGTNTIATVTNNFPLVIGAGLSNITAQSCSFRGPIATANGGAFSVYSSNSAAPAHLLNIGSVGNSNAASVHGIITALVTNQTQLR